MNMTLDDIMFVRAVFLKKINPLCVLYPCHDTNEYCDTGIVPALIVVMVEVSGGC